MKLASARRATIEASDLLPGTTNYFVGRDRRQWRTRIPTYARITYRNVYPGIDQVYYGTDRELEYDFIVAPGAHPSAIQVDFPGARLRLDEHGDLLVDTGRGVFRQHKPIVYQTVNGERLMIGGNYLLQGRSLSDSRWDRMTRAGP